MSFPNDQRSLPLLGGAIQPQRLIVPVEVIRRIKSYRDACRLAYKLRRKGVTQRLLAASVTGLYAPHISDYFSVHPNRRELPARHVGAVSSALGNTVIPQWLAQDAAVTLLEEMQTERQHGARAA